MKYAGSVLEVYCWRNMIARAVDLMVILQQLAVSSIKIAMKSDRVPGVAQISAALGTASTKRTLLP